MNTLDRIEAWCEQLAEDHAACHRANETSVRFVGQRGQAAWALAEMVRPLLPMLRSLVVADDEWEDVVGPDSTASLEMCSAKAKAADDAVRALLRALRSNPSDPGREP